MFFLKVLSVLFRKKPCTREKGWGCIFFLTMASVCTSSDPNKDQNFSLNWPRVQISLQVGISVCLLRWNLELCGFFFGQRAYL